VLYNGTEEMPDDEQELRLSDAFFREPGAQQPTNLELVVKVYNINKGRNVEMAKRSPMLDGYETFVAMVRENNKTMDLKTAVKKAVEDCIKLNILKNFMQTHKKERASVRCVKYSAVRVRTRQSIASSRYRVFGAEAARQGLSVGQGV